MKGLSRRTFLKGAGATPILFSLGLGAANRANAADVVTSTLGVASPPTGPDPSRSAQDISNTTAFIPGYLSILQGPTSKTEALFNLFAPRLKNYTYVVTDASGANVTVAKYASVAGPGFYNIDKVKATGLRLGERYTLRVMDGRTAVDERNFSALDTDKANPNFAMISCMADDYRFTEVIGPMWEKLRAENPDFVIFNGDTVYVDSFEFVERKKATEADLWQRYADSCKTIPFYHWRNLVPTFTTWDDHDFGTNDGDRTFISRDMAGKLFHGFFLGTEITNWTQGPQGVSSVLSAFGQRFYFMDDRTFRQPNKDQTSSEPYGHWGQEQHAWLLAELAKSNSPAWIINGNQCFNGVALDFKENFEANHPAEFATFINQLKTIHAPVVFASGDVHLSEVQRVPRDRIGYETFEFTSSSMHSYAGAGWDNPVRVPGAYCKEFNFLMFQTAVSNRGALQIDVKCVGLIDQPYFTQRFTVSN